MPKRNLHNIYIVFNKKDLIACFSCRSSAEVFRRGYITHCKTSYGLSKQEIIELEDEVIIREEEVNPPYMLERT